MAKQDLTKICERLRGLETANEGQTEKINEIHKILVGNGQPGLIQEWNQWKGGIKIVAWFFGVVLTILGIVVAID